MMPASEGKSRRSKRAWSINSPYVRLLQKKLMQKALAPWPRRDSSLLEVNCGEGDLLKTYWQSGFEISATESEPQKRLKALQKNIPGLDMRAAGDEDLPFEDGSFDWVVLNVRHCRRDQLQAAIGEALRVGKRGIMIAFWNTFSLAALIGRLTGKQNALPPFAVSWREILEIARLIPECRLNICSTLWMPQVIRHPRCFFAKNSLWITGLPFGAWCIVRLDFVLRRPLTGLPLRLSQSFNRVEPALEYAEKRIIVKKNHDQ